MYMWMRIRWHPLRTMRWQCCAGLQRATQGPTGGFTLCAELAADVRTLQVREPACLQSIQVLVFSATA